MTTNSPTATRYASNLRNQTSREPPSGINPGYVNGHSAVSGPFDLRDLQKSAVECWVNLVMPVRPQWTAGQARFAVHAAMALVIDLGRLMGHQNSEQARVVVAAMVDLTLLGRYRLRAALPAR